MRIGRTAPLTIAVVALLAAATAGAASAHEFIAEPTSAGAKLSARAESTQVFTIGTASEPNIECTAAKLEGTVASEKQVTQEVIVHYEECTAHDSGLSAAATVSAARYELSAEGTVTLQAPIEIKTLFGAQTISVQSLGGISYSNRPSEGGLPPGILLTSKVTGINSTGVFGTSATGTYIGILLLLPISGGLRWL
ncbi:MAG: hypothetical protein WB698_10705 [Solirubrobacteraceae bacterium]